MSSRGATLLYHFCPLTAVSDCLMRSPLRSGFCCSQTPGNSCCKGKSPLFLCPKLATWRKSISKALPVFLCFFARLPPSREERTLSPVRAEERAALLCRRAVCDGCVILFGPVLYQTQRLKKTFQFVCTMTLGPAMKITSLHLFFCLKLFPDLSFIRTSAR